MNMNGSTVTAATRATDDHAQDYPTAFTMPQCVSL